MISIRKGSLLTEIELDDAVYQLIQHAGSIGMIPIAGILSRRIGEKHEVLGFGWNQLRAGIPGVHGETGAIIGMGRRRGGYADIIATSSLSPCPFCQCCLALQMGIRQVRILDAINYTPDYSGYQRVGISPIVKNHRGIAAVFKKWVNDPANATIWARDIGIYDGKVQQPFDVNNRKRLKTLVSMAEDQATLALEAGEAPIGALVIDPHGEVLGSGHSQVKTFNDPSRVAAISAWRAAGARDHWKDKTLLLTAGPDHIAYAMFHVFNFGQLIVVDGSGFDGRTKDVSQKAPMHRVKGENGPMREWMRNAKNSREYLGAI